jgi:hypothetical protein
MLGAMTQYRCPKTTSCSVCKYHQNALPTFLVQKATASKTYSKNDCQARAHPAHMTHTQMCLFPVNYRLKQHIALNNVSP